MSRNPEPLTLENPLDIGDARLASRRLADQRRQAEKDHEAAVLAAADAEKKYRKEYAKAIVKAEGAVPVREAQAKADTAELAADRDVKAAMVKVWAERLKGLEGERSQVKSLMDWSARMDPETWGESRR